VGALLDGPNRAYRDIFMSEPRFEGDRLFIRPHATVAGAETWLHRSRYFEGKLDYWYAFAGDPDASLTGGPRSATAAAPGPQEPAIAVVEGSVTGMASSYPESSGWEGKATVALPLEIGGGAPDGRPSYVLVCADRCVSLPVVDSCPCYVGTADQRVANLSHEAWRQVSDMPLEEGLIEVEITLSPVAVRPSGPPDS
jgi:hypothetical protein